jgi:hypothetical protein
MRSSTRIGAVAAVVVAAACSTSKLLDVNAPNSVPVTVFDNPGAASLMVNSVIGNFECAFGAAVGVEGIISDELADAVGRGKAPDRRDASTQTNGIYGTGCGIAGVRHLPPLSKPAEHDEKKLTAWSDAGWRIARPTSRK